jgi:hypothetical protein
LREISERVWLSIVDIDDVATMAVPTRWLPRRDGIGQMIRRGESVSASSRAIRRHKPRSL